jgi:hypothetical protein
MDEQKAADGTQADVIDSKDPVLLANALKFEREKNKVLVEEVVALEDELVNRSMAEFDAIVTDETREFWREQLLTNRAAATVALNEMARVKSTAADGGGGKSGDPSTNSGQARRPLHNRAVARPVVPAVAGGAAGSGQPGDTDDRAAKIRNRAHEISKAESVAFSVAFRRAERELSGRGQ